jgi:hypothetical protein
VKVFLIPRDHARSDFHYETDTDDQQAPELVYRPGLRGRIERAAQRLHASLRQPKGRVTRAMKQTNDWLRRFVYPDEPLLSALRRARAIEVHHGPDPLAAGGEVRDVWLGYLRGRRRRHLAWFTVDALLSPLSLLLTPLPGPNVIGYWFAYRAVCHLLILVGIRRALSGRVEITFHPSAQVAATPTESMIPTEPGTQTDTDIEGGIERSCDC